MIDPTNNLSECTPSIRCHYRIGKSALRQSFGYSASDIQRAVDRFAEELRAFCTGFLHMFLRSFLVFRGDQIYCLLADSLNSGCGLVAHTGYHNMFSVVLRST
jgi:hypothetical protein